MTQRTHTFPKLHNAMWPAVVGKGGEAGEPAISLEEMLDLTVAAEVDGQKFDGVDLFLGPPHLKPDASEDDIRRLADMIAAKGLTVGSLVAPVWPGMGGGSAMGDLQNRKKFVAAVQSACCIARVLDRHGVRQSGVIRIDSADSPANWAANPIGNTAKVAVTFGDAARVASDSNQRLAVEGEICWGGLHSWRHVLDVLEAVHMPYYLGFQADMAHTYLFLLGYNAPEHTLLASGYLQDDYTDEQFWAAYQKLTDALRPWTNDVHIAQNDGTVFGSGSHDKTGRHCMVDDPKGKLKIVECAGCWLQDSESRLVRHVCWDGCMFSNQVLRNPKTWTAILGTMIQIRNAHGWDGGGM